MTGYSTKQDKINQDYSCFHSFMSHKELTRVYVLADGHGTNGHHASRLASSKFINSLEAKISSCADEQLTDDLMKQFLEESYLDVQQIFTTEEDYPRLYKHSGTTLVVAVIRKLTFYLANCGDSKGFLAHQTGGKIQVTLESKEHKPDEPEEKQRIELAGGKVCPFRDYDGSYSGPDRVWNKTETEPGLACSRSLGDLLAHQLGVISRPGKLVGSSRCFGKEARPT
jgi:serine/threonine protein phosphatase PrpC